MSITTGGCCRAACRQLATLCSEGLRARAARSLEAYSALMNEATELLLARIDRAAREGAAFDIHQAVGEMTLQVVGSTAFGCAAGLSRFQCLCAGFLLQTATALSLLAANSALRALLDGAAARLLVLTPQNTCAAAKAG